MKHCLAWTLSPALPSAPAPAVGTGGDAECQKGTSGYPSSAWALDNHPGRGNHGAAHDRRIFLRGFVKDCSTTLWDFQHVVKHPE